MNTAALCLALFVSSCAPQEPGQTILSRVHTLKSEVPKLKLSKEETSDYLDQLALVQRDVEGGRNLLGLYDLLGADPDIESERYFASKAAVADSGRKGFDKEWSTAGRAMRPRTQELAGSFSSMSGANRALAQLATIQSGAYWDSGRLYGYNTTLENGLAYIGLAEGMLGYAEFCQRLPQPKAESSTVYGLDGDLQALDRDIVASLSKVGEKDQNFLVRVNANYKLAVDLNKKGWDEGALIAYAKSARGLSNLRPSGNGPLVASEVRSRLALAQSALGERSNGTLPRLFAEMVEQDLASGSTADLQRAGALVDKVFPILARTSAPMLATASKKAKVRVTLVRWPYT